MSDFRTRLLGITALGMALAGISYGQVTATTFTAGPELTLRAEGETELVGDTTTTFTNGGATVNNVTVYVTLSVPVTGKSVTGIVGVNTTATLNITGGLPAQNVQGLANGTTVTFTGLQLAAGANVVTVSDIRVNATGAGNPLVSESILLSYPNTPTTSANVAGSANPVAVGYILPSLSSGLPVGTFLFPFQTCVGGTSLTTPLSNPATLNVTTGPTFRLNINELTAGAWKNQAGENDVAFADATQATQIALAFANVPASVTIYVPISVSTAGGTILNLAGTPTPFSSTIPYAGYTPTNNTVTVTYTVTTATATTGTAVVPVYISFARNSATPQAAITVLASYTPSAALTAPTGIIPTFAPSTATPTNLETLVNCQTTLLFPYVTNVTGFETGIAIVNATTDNLGTIPGFPSAATPISGACTVNFYPGGTATQPAAFTTPLIGVGGTTTGSIAAFTLSSASGATNFTGYAIASCPFPQAHGFGYIVDNFGTPSGTAEGYLAVVVPNGRGENSFAITGAGTALTVTGQ